MVISGETEIASRMDLHLGSEKSQLSKREMKETRKNRSPSEKCLGLHRK